VRSSAALRSRVPRARDASADLQAADAPSAALEQVESWRESPTLSLLGEQRRIVWAAEDARLAGQVKGLQIHEARIVAICRANDVRELWSADRDSSRSVFTAGIRSSGSASATYPYRPSMYSAVFGCFGLRKSWLVGACSTSSPNSMKMHSSLARRAWAMLCVTITIV
jgi:hypothetical protein